MRRQLVFSAVIASGVALFGSPSAYAQQGWQGASSGYPVQQAQVLVNGQPLEPAALAQMGGQVPPGQYWYDAQSGAYGVWGGPTQGFIQAGLPIPAPLPPNASNGNTGVFINGRNLPQQDLAGVNQLAGRTLQPGRYLVNAQGQLSMEGGGQIADLKAQYQQQSQQSSQSVAPVQNGKTGQQRFPGWNIHYTVPSGWFVGADKKGLQTVGSNTKPGILLVQRALLRDPAELRAQFTKLMAVMKLQVTEHPSYEQSEKDGKRVVFGTMKARDIQGREFKIRLGAVFSGQGTALVVTGGAIPNEFETVKTAVKGIVNSAEVGMPRANNQAIVGQYSTYSSSGSISSTSGGVIATSESFFKFYADGTYHTNTNSMVYGQTRDVQPEDLPGTSQTTTSMFDEPNGTGARYVVLGDVLIFTSPAGRSYHNFEMICSTALPECSGIEVDGNRYIKDK